jgi:hypothetical protein
MDSGVAAGTGGEYSVHIVLRAQASDFPGEDPDALWERARQLGKSLSARGYSESDVRSVPILDPGDQTKTLDTWYEVGLSRSLGDLADLVIELRFALGLDKTVPGPGR